MSNLFHYNLAITRWFKIMEQTHKQIPKPATKQETKEEKIEKLKKKTETRIDIRKNDLEYLGNLYNSNEEIENQKKQNQQ